MFNLPLRASTRVPPPCRRRLPRLAVELLEDRALLNAATPLADWRLLVDQPFTRSEVIASVRSPRPLAELAALGVPGSSFDPASSQVLFGRADNWMIQVALRPGAEPLAAIAQLEALPFVNWAAPNFVYTRDADPREFTPNDPRYSQQYHHPRMQNDLAWDMAGLGSTAVVVAVTDDGVDLYHQDLYENIWINQYEIPATRLANLIDLDQDGLITFRDLNAPENQGPFKANDVNSDSRIDARDLLAPMQLSGDEDLGGGGWANRVDDGENLYVDDIVGWATIDNTNNPHPTGALAHGTHVAGITAARTNNAVGVAGTAGDVLIMPIRFYGNGSWTSAVVARSYAYAAENGARIITTSYNVDSMASDPVFIAGVQYMYDLGVLHFNSGGNGSQADSNRQRLDHTLYVCSTNVNDAKSGFSNWGYGMDLCAPGENILSTLPNNSYGNNSGTSMASPNAAGVAALLWSLYPTWTREEVASQVLRTCDNIDNANPAFAGRLGCGRVNSFRAVVESSLPPSFRRVNGLPAEGGSTGAPIRTFQVDLEGVYVADTIHDAANWEMREAGADGLFDTDDDVLIPLDYGTTLGTPYMIGTNRLYFTLANALPAGAYRFRAMSGGLYDPFWQPLDGNSDGIGGDPFDRHFFVAGAAPGSSPGEGGGSGDVIAVLLHEAATWELAQDETPVVSLPIPIRVVPITLGDPIPAVAGIAVDLPAASIARVLKDTFRDWANELAFG